MNRLTLVTVMLILATLALAFHMLNRNYARALDQCERIHTRETCIHMMR